MDNIPAASATGSPVGTRVRRPDWPLGSRAAGPGHDTRGGVAAAASNTWRSCRPDAGESATRTGAALPRGVLSLSPTSRATPSGLVRRSTPLWRKGSSLPRSRDAWSLTRCPGALTRKSAERTCEVPRATPRPSVSVASGSGSIRGRCLRSSGFGRDGPRCDEVSRWLVHERRSGLESPQLHQAQSASDLPKRVLGTRRLTRSNVAYPRLTAVTFSVWPEMPADLLTLSCVAPDLPAAAERSRSREQPPGACRAGSSPGASHRARCPRLLRKPVHARPLVIRVGDKHFAR